MGVFVIDEISSQEMHLGENLWRSLLNIGQKIQMIILELFVDSAIKAL